MRDDDHTPYEPSIVGYKPATVTPILPAKLTPKKESDRLYEAIEGEDGETHLPQFPRLPPNFRPSE